MGKRGPSKTPTAILQARGSWRAQTRADEPQADGVPQPPDWLTPAARAVWDALLPMLLNMRVVGEVDVWTLAIYCSLFARWRRCEAFIAEHGETFTNSYGQETEYPAAARASKLADQLTRIGSQFGLTPAARAGLPLIAPKPDDKDSSGIERFFNPRLAKL